MNALVWLCNKLLKLVILGAIVYLITEHNDVTIDEVAQLGTLIFAVMFLWVLFTDVPRRYD